MGARRRGRELAFQVLFQMDVGSAGVNYALLNFQDLKHAQKPAADFAAELATGASEKMAEIDEAITKVSKNWNFARLATVDRAILRLGAYELLYRPEIPPEVTMNECIELAKSFGTDDSAAFVNGVLDQLRKDAAA